MSLLHDALRKAERARDEAQPPPKRTELAAVPLEIIGEPVAPPAPPSLALEPEPSVQPAPTRPDSTGSDQIEGELRVPDSRRAFYIAVALAAIAAIAAAGYFWNQLRPVTVIAKHSPPRAVTVAPATAAPVAQAPASSDGAMLPGLPPNVPSSPPTAEPPATRETQPAPAPPTAPSKLAPRRERTLPESPIVPPYELRPIRTAQPAIHPRVQTGYAAYQSGDLALARAEYQEALRADSSNRDALLGIAAVESRSGRPAEAEGHYRRVLQADPRDPHAHAGLLALRAQRVDPLQAETRIKTLIAGDPEASVLHFSLGNQYARQGRWDEAQLAYAKAHAADPANPDFAFNRAVSLDHLRQRAAALEQYRLALDLAGTRVAYFSLERARERIEHLSR
jgi:tetratricopeptide (TPR) repeat protein